MTEQFDTRVAAFTPKEVVDLRPSMVGKIGQSATFQAQYVIEEGPYAGQFSWLSREPGWYWWIPECDLTFAD